jgi:putative redox protein
MAVRMSGFLKGGTVDVALVHELSQATLRTTAPRDNGGDGSSFSPTDLCAVSLGSCAITTISMYANKHGISLESIDFTVEKEMTSSPPRRIQKLTLVYNIKTMCSEEDFSKLKHAGNVCPVRKSLHPDVEVLETYNRI